MTRTDLPTLPTLPTLRTLRALRHAAALVLLGCALGGASAAAKTAPASCARTRRATPFGAGLSCPWICGLMPSPSTRAVNVPLIAAPSSISPKRFVSNMPSDTRNRAKSKVKGTVPPAPCALVFGR